MQTAAALIFIGYLGLVYLALRIARWALRDELRDLEQESTEETEDD